MPRAIAALFLGPYTGYVSRILGGPALDQLDARPCAADVDSLTAKARPAASRRRTPSRPFRLEADLYAPVKRFLEALGYEVKGEVRGCDVVAVRPGALDPPLVVELKLAFTLGVVLQGLDRLALTDLVYLAVPAARPGPGRRASRGVVARPPRRAPAVPPAGRRPAGGPSAGRRPAGGPGRGGVRPPCPPARVPRKNKARAALLLGEHARRQGDPNRGGTGGKPLLTAYRQEALRCAGLLQRHAGGPLPVALLRDQADAPDAARILHRNVYGWFEPAGRGLYRITAEGLRGLELFHAAAVATGTTVP